LDAAAFDRIAYVWAGFFHVFFPELAARSIGWAVSPFQFESGVAGHGDRHRGHASF
jgi:hypothetical protein